MIRKHHSSYTVIAFWKIKKPVRVKSVKNCDLCIEKGLLIHLLTCNALRLPFGQKVL